MDRENSGIPMGFRGSESNPSVRNIEPEVGYTRGGVAVETGWGVDRGE